VSRKYILAAVAVVLVVVGVLVAVSLTGGDDGASAEDVQGIAAVQRELQGVPQDGNVLGRKSAPVTIVEYGDISCPACRSASTGSLPEVVERWVRPGEAKMEFRPIAFINASSERGALGALAAARQDQLWGFVQAAYRNQGAETSDWFTEDMMTEIVRRLGMDVEAWRADFEGDAVVNEFFEWESRASEAGVSQTPTFVVSGPRGERTLLGAVGVEEFAAAIEEVGPAS
jgi:protein-disulfide isomerase